MKRLEEFNEERKSWHARSYFKLLKVSGEVEVTVKRALKTFGLTHAQLNVLNLLAGSYPDTMDAKSLKELLIVQSPDLTRLLDRLVKKELVDRKTCPDNRRKLDILITEKGLEQFYNAHFEVKTKLRNFFEDDITKEEAKELFRILNKLNH